MAIANKLCLILAIDYGWGDSSWWLGRQFMVVGAAVHGGWGGS